MDDRDKQESGSPSSARDRLPPKLREKLEATQGMAESGGSGSGSPLSGIISVVIVILLAVGGFFWWKSNSKAVEKAAAQAHQDSLLATAAAESAAAVASADSIAQAAADTAAMSPGGAPATVAAKPAAEVKAAVAARSPVETKAPVAAKAVPPAAKSPPSPAAATDAAPAPARSGAGGFGIDVGTFLFEDRADVERSRLEGITGLTGIVSPTTSGGDNGFRVILGKFAGRAQAEQKAAALVDSNWVRQAKVVARPK